MGGDPFKEFECIGCSVNTHYIQEYYMIHDHLWEIVNPKMRGMLCLGCVENLLGRSLTPADFTDCPLNKSINMGRGIVCFKKSPRLMNRLGY